MAIKVGGKRLNITRLLKNKKTLLKKCPFTLMLV